MSKRRFFLRIAALFLNFAVILNAYPVRAQIPDPFGGVAIGIGLSVLGDKVKEAVEKAIAGGLILEVQAGGQVAIAIQQAKAAFEQEADLTWKQLNAQQQTMLNSVATLGNQFIDKTYSSLDDLAAHAQVILHTLPFSKTFPQVYKFTPTWVEQNAGHPVHLDVRGDFYDILRKNYDASASLNNQTVTNSTKTSQQLGFEIPESAIATQPGAVTSNTMHVSIPYRVRTFLFFSKKKWADVLLPLMALPREVGTVTFNVTTYSSGIERKNLVSPEMSQESYDDDIICGGEHADQAIHLAFPESGWRIIPSTVTWQVNWSQGSGGTGNDWWLDRNCSSYTTACLCVSTRHHGLGTSGKVHFNILYTEEHDITVPSTVVRTLQLGWGQSRVLELPVGATWTGSYTRFDGKRFDFATPYQDNFISVGQTANILTIRTAPFQIINEKAFEKALDDALHKPKPKNP